MPRTIFFAVFFAFLISCKHSGQTSTEKNPVLAKPPIASFTEGIAKSPSADAYYQRGVALHHIMQDTLAIADFKKAAALDSSKAKYFSAVGNLLFDHKDLTGSVTWLQKALARDPEDVQAHLKLAKAMLFIKEYPKAFEQINTVLRRDAYNPEGYYLKGLIYKDMKDTAHALSSFMTAVNVAPDYKDALIQIGQLYLAQNNTTGLQYLDNAFRLDTTDVFPIYARGTYYQQRGNMEQAKEEFRRAIMHDRNYADAYFGMGYIYLQLDSFEKALRQFDLVTKIAPTNSRAYYNRGLCAELMGNKEAAKQDYSQALEFDKDYAQAKEGLRRLK